MGIGQRNIAPSIHGAWKMSHRRGLCVSTISPRPLAVKASAKHRA
jgi:hypothetical protein